MEQVYRPFDFSVTISNFPHFGRVLAPHQADDCARLEEEGAVPEAAHAVVPLVVVVRVRQPEGVGKFVRPGRASKGHVCVLVASEVQRVHQSPEVSNDAVVLLRRVLRHEAVAQGLVADVGLHRHVVDAVHDDSTVDVVVHRVVLDDQARRVPGEVYVERVPPLNRRLPQIRKLHAAHEAVIRVRMHEVAANWSAILPASDNDVAAQRRYLCRDEAAGRVAALVRVFERGLHLD
mmetsp:Transcript_119547/g.338337  ORF Transcript_119547/g.338337 Transcript_119547/m.338337 type:complete len:234 (+) Transcript_119547:683-1384(+)